MVEGATVTWRYVNAQTYISCAVAFEKQCKLQNFKWGMIIGFKRMVHFIYEISWWVHLAILNLWCLTCTGNTEMKALSLTVDRVVTYWLKTHRI